MFINWLHLKGVWLPPKGKDGTSKKIPVAIKVLKEPDSAGQNYAKFTEAVYDEALVMASVQHQHLVRLIGICMTSQTMLISQLLPLGCLLDYLQKEKNITSKMMLNWSAQIAKVGEDWNLPIRFICFLVIRGCIT